jgi:hypothetical protein
MIEKNQTPQVFFVSLIIYDYILKNLQLDAQDYNFYVFKHIL